MHIRCVSLASLLASVSIACAAPPPTDVAAAPAASPASLPSTGPARWTASLSPTQQRSARAAPTSQNKAYGTVFLAAAGPERTRVRLTVSTPINAANTVLWAIYPGRCGTGSVPIVGIERFPIIEVSNNGRGEVDAEMALRMPDSGTFHVNVFWGRSTGLQDVMTCGNLRREGA